MVFDAPGKVLQPLVLHTLLAAVPIVGAVAAWIAMATGRLAWSVSFTIVAVALLDLVHYWKAVQLGLPLYFADHVLLVEGLRAARETDLAPEVDAVLAIAVAAAVFAAWRLRDVRVPRRSWRRRWQHVLAWTVLAALAVPNIALSPADLFPLVRFFHTGVMKVGLVPFLAASVRYGRSMPQPPGYGAEAIARIEARYPPASAAPASPPRPDIVFYGIESLMDYEALDVRYNEDPMPFFTALRRASGSRTLLTPTFGGQTVQPEFELLTGLSMDALPSPNPLAYVNASLRSFPNACDALHPLGYRCIGLNAVTSDNFQRDRAYRRFGFDIFGGLDTLYAGKDPVRLANGRLPDALLVRHFVAQLPPDAPVLAYLMTDSTHTDYSRWPFPAAYGSKRKDLDGFSRIVLQAYGAAVHQADGALEQLVAAYRSSGRPVVLVAFGDHVPANFGHVLDALGATRREGWDTSGAYRTPLAVWSQGVAFDWPQKVVSPNLVLAELAPMLFADWKPPLQFRVATALAKRWTALSRVGVDRDGVVTARGDIDDEAARDYAMVEYDLLAGGRFCQPAP